MSDSDIFPHLPEAVRRDVLLISQRYIINDVRFLKVRTVGLGFLPAVWVGL